MALLWASHYIPPKADIRIPILSSLGSHYASQNPTSIHFKHNIRFKFSCSSNEKPEQILEGFSTLEFDSPWERDSVWSTMALYFFSLHIPMSFGGLSVVARLLNQPDLEPQVKALSVLVIEILELFSALLLLHFTAKPQYKPLSFFKLENIRSERNWVVAALLGLLFLAVAMFFTSFLADELFGAKGVNNQTVKEILLGGHIAQTACILVYCIVAPLLEEIIYRRFFLASLAPSMGWHQAVVLSSVIFSAAHLSGENFIQLFIVGVVLGCSYCWTGDLRSSILLHSMYNALTLLITLLT